MTFLSISIDTTSYRFEEQVKRGGNILCNFYLEVNEIYFPDNPWLDFPVIVLKWWIDNCILLINTDGEIDNSFMNGPYEFITVKNQDSIKLSFRKRSLNNFDDIATPVEIPFSTYRQALLQAADILINALEQYSVSGRELDKLKASVNLFRSSDV
ncbi:MAG: hypothetical protein V7L21_34390 [Nostoc sp.]|uniref:hypothetical protein n=1 Tax=unclassified Nostoc TaxID=2593658 RepID=UPI0025F79E18|nr:hypothetical protein [Nostoc sp. NMS9]MBN3941447.1 hypothetical protein [Nostoc sp. NMS9]